MARIRHEKQIFPFSPYCQYELPPNRPRTRSCRVRAQIKPLPLFRYCLQGKAFPKAQNVPELKFGGITGKIELSTGNCGLPVDNWRKQREGEAFFETGM